jgi:hypothetical protein
MYSYILQYVNYSIHSQQRLYCITEPANVKYTKTTQDYLIFRLCSLSSILKNTMFQNLHLYMKNYTHYAQSKSVYF